MGAKAKTFLRMLCLSKGIYFEGIQREITGVKFGYGTLEEYSGDSEMFVGVSA